MVERDQGIGLGVVGRRVPDRRGVGDEAEIMSATVFDGAVRAGPFRTEIDPIAVGVTERGDVLGVDEHDAPTALDAAVTVTESVDGGVVLIVAAHRLQDQTTLRYRYPAQWVDHEIRFGSGCFKSTLIAGRVRQHESVGLSDAHVEVVEAQDDARRIRS